jgi:hypothetical protein
LIIDLPSTSSLILADPGICSSVLSIAIPCQLIFVFARFLHLSDSLPPLLHAARGGEQESNR